MDPNTDIQLEKMEIRSLLVLKLQTSISPGMKRRGDKPNKLLISVL
jgi:hypothetical protein